MPYITTQASTPPEAPSWGPWDLGLATPTFSDLGLLSWTWASRINGILWGYHGDMGMGQYLLIPFLVGWTSIYQLFWCSPGVQGFDTLPYHDFVGIIDILWGSWRQLGIEPLYKRMISIRKLRRIWPFQGREGLRGTNVTWWCQSDSPSSLTTNRPMSKTIFKNARSPKDHQRSIVWC